MKRYRINSVRGFTLLELLVAVAVFAVISAAAYAGLQSGLDTAQGTERALERLAEIQHAFARLERDISQTVPRPIRQRYGEVAAPIEGAGDDDKVLSLTRGGWRNPLNRPRATLLRVDYRLVDGVLLRDTWPVLDRAQDSAPRSSEVMAGLDDLSLRYLDSTRKWRDSWEQDAQNPAPELPLAIEVTLRAEDFGSLIRIFRVAG